VPYATAPDGVRLYYEEAGTGTPIVFVHEFSGDLRSWEPQIQFFSRRYRCVAFNARGYPPSDVPSRVASYAPDISVNDIAAIMRHLKLRRAHIMGCSMGSQSTLHFGLTYPRQAISLTAIGAGSGSNFTTRAEQKRVTEENARRYEEDGLGAVLERLRKAPNRVRLKRKNPRAWEDFGKRFLEHSAQGCANTQRGVQARRLPLTKLSRELGALTVPTHLIVGDEDTAAVDASLFVQRACPAASLTVVAATGHLVNIEEPELLNRIAESFYALVEGGQWRPRPS
jgi:pimeloyl-ACP methyl ester carboxylesterase